MRDEVAGFPALRSHQRHAWHAFLVQLGALAVHRAGLSEPPTDPAAWLRLIRGLTPGHPGDAPWNLVVDDMTRPAFMQPPVSSSDRLDDYRSSVATPDGLDILIISKNHDLKSAVAWAGKPEDWLFALISLQTAAGFSGAGNYGISRMNGGLGCRPAFSVTPSTSPGVHVRRDIEALLERREQLLDEYPTVGGGAALIWTLAWDGTRAEALPLSALDPFYVEVCRRVRLRSDGNGILHAIRATSGAARIAAKALRGLTGDPWTPINVKEGKSLTLAAGGFTYRRVTDYLTSSDWRLPPLFGPTEAERASPRSTQLVARAVVRGQGRTEGYHERIVPLNEKAVRAFGRARGAQELGDIARERIEQAGLVQRVLRHAVAAFAAGGDTAGIRDEHRARANPWANRLDEIVDAGFFESLQDEFDVDDPEERRRVRREWLHGVIGHARRVLRDAQASLPCPAVWRYRARARAEGVFEGRVRGANGFPWLFEQEETVRDDHNA